MDFFRLVFFITFFILPSLSADPILVKSIEDVETYVHTLRSQGVKPEKVGVILDFHGVVTKEEIHQKPLTLKGKIVNFLNYLQEEKIPYCIATAWNDFPAVIQEGIITLKLEELLGVDRKQQEMEASFKVGQNDSVTLKGYKNGKVVALKYHDSDNIFFRQKAFSLEVVYQSLIPEYILLVDDGPANLKEAQKDFAQTVYSDKKLILFHLKNPKINLEKSNPVFSSKDDSWDSSDSDEIEWKVDPRERLLQGHASPYITSSNGYGKSTSSSSNEEVNTN